MHTKTWLANVSFNTSRKQTDPSAYRWSVMHDPELHSPTGRLVQVGPTTNGIVRYVGTFETRAEAERAIRAYMLAPSSERWWIVTVEKNGRTQQRRIKARDADDAGRQTCALIGGPDAHLFTVVRCTEEG
jgi:hypothetical protein